MAGNTDENRTAVATVPVATNSTYGSPATVDTSEPKPKPKASRKMVGSTVEEKVVERQ